MSSVVEERYEIQKTVHGQFINIVREHLAIALSVVTLLAMTIRVLLAAHGDMMTVTAIINHQGLSGLLAILFALGLPFIAGVLLFSTATDLGEAIREEDGLKGHLWGLGWALVFAIVTLPKSWFLTMGAYGAGVLLYSASVRLVRGWRIKRDQTVHWLLQKTDGHRTKSAGALFALAAVLGLLTLLVADNMWLPKEKLTFGGKANSDM